MVQGTLFTQINLLLTFTLFDFEGKCRVCMYTYTHMYMYTFLLSEPLESKLYIPSPFTPKYRSIYFLRLEIFSSIMMQLSTS